MVDQETKDLLESRFEGRAEINDFANLIKFQWLLVASENFDLDDMEVLFAAMTIAAKSAGKE